jgi:HD-like signal output (HDOD) protein
MALTRSSFEDIVDRIHTIPSLPEVVTQVVRLVNDPNSDARQINAIMMKDAAMAAKMLRMVNSVYYGLAEPVNDLEQAIVILGFKTIRSVALSISVLNMFQQQNANFNMKAFWAHSAVSACLGRLICGKARICDPEFGFTVGLLKGLGKVILAENAPEETRAVIAVARQYRMSFTKACREVMDTDDAEIGAWLMERWELDKVLVATVREQCLLSPTTKEPKLVSMCMLSEYLCALKKIRTSGQCDEPQLDPAVWTHLGMDKTALVEVLAVINDEVENARQLLSIAA